MVSLRAYVPSLDFRLSTTTALNKAIDRKFKEAGIVIASPSATFTCRRMNPCGSASTKSGKRVRGDRVMKETGYEIDAARQLHEIPPDRVVVDCREKDARARRHGPGGVRDVPVLPPRRMVLTRTRSCHERIEQGRRNTTDRMRHGPLIRRRTVPETRRMEQVMTARRTMQLAMILALVALLTTAGVAAQPSTR